MWMFVNWEIAEVLIATVSIFLIFFLVDNESSKMHFRIKNEDKYTLIWSGNNFIKILKWDTIKSQDIVYLHNL